ncbi:MAG: SDR family oxidoreductase [Acidimicrobiales bacterium]|nr:SDR family oxidoreductase [Acidimicrobiales bacterium]
MVVNGTVGIVTGAARGIGFALADRFLAEGAAGITVVDLDRADVDAALADLTARHGDRVLGVAADVTDEAAVASFVAATEERFGPVGLFAANAGIGTGQGIEADLATWDRIWHVNVMAHVLAARAVVPGMVERGGGIFLTTASAAGLLAQIGDAGYSVTKHAAVSFAEWLSITYGDRGLQVACLCPQGVNTAMLQSVMGGAATATVKAQGVIEPTDVADAVIDALADRRFLVLPHPEVAEYMQRRASDPDRWLAGMRKLQARIVAALREG